MFFLFGNRHGPRPKVKMVWTRCGCGLLIEEINGDIYSINEEYVEEHVENRIGKYCRPTRPQFLMRFRILQ